MQIQQRALRSLVLRCPLRQRRHDFHGSPCSKLPKILHQHQCLSTSPSDLFEELQMLPPRFAVSTHLPLMSLATSLFYEAVARILCGLFPTQHPVVLSRSRHRHEDLTGSRRRLEIVRVEASLASSSRLPLPCPQQSNPSAARSTVPSVPAPFQNTLAAAKLVSICLQA